MEGQGGDGEPVVFEGCSVVTQSKLYMGMGYRWIDTDVLIPDRQYP